MAVTIPAITNPMTKSEKIMLRQLWPPSAYVRSCEQRQRSSSSAIDRSIPPASYIYIKCTSPHAIREKMGKNERSRSKHGPCTMVIGLLVDLIFLPPGNAKFLRFSTFLPLRLRCGGYRWFKCDSPKVKLVSTSSRIIRIIR